MKITLALLFLLLFPAAYVYSQTDSSNHVAEQIKAERDNKMQELSAQLKRNDAKVDSLIKELEKFEKTRDLSQRVRTLEDLQKTLNDRLLVLDTTPRARTKFNGQLAFTELLSIQRDIKPLNLFTSSKRFFEQLGNISNMQQYNDFTSWKVQYDEWYKTQNADKNKLLPYVNQALNIVSNGARQIPLYGSFVQTVSSGISSLLSSFGKKEGALASKTPQMLNLLNVTSQFEQQKAILDHEWELINKELEALQTENARLITEQLTYYGLNTSSYKKEYLDQTLETERDEYKTFCRQQIQAKLTALDQNEATKQIWQGDVETFMYKVQSLRTRFGVLTGKMLSNIDRYNKLIDTFSSLADAPAEFKTKIQGLRQSLGLVRENFVTAFNPAKYVEDSAVMYIQRKSSRQF